MEDEKIERLRERILQCPICMDEFQDPRILPCHHSVCLNCLLNYVRHSSSSGRLFRCPQCRSDVCVPRGGVNDFPPNFYINCIQDELGARPYFGICDVCQRDWLVSQYRCVNCDQDICKFCIHEHKLFKHSFENEANIMRIETGNIGMSLSSQKDCPTHEKESLQMFCVTCDTLVCMTCICEEHKSHETMPLSRKLSQAQKELQGELDRLGKQQEQVGAALKELTDLQDAVVRDRDQCVKAIRVHARALTLEIDAQAELKVERASRTGVACLQELEKYTAELSSYRDHLQRGAAFLENLEEGDISLELINTYHKYKMATEVTHKSIGNRTIKHDYPDFSPGTLHKWHDYRFFHFGKLDSKRKETTFMSASSKKTGWRQRICVGWWRLLVGLMGLVILLTITDMAHSLYTRPGTFTQTLTGLLFFVYITAAAVCAYLKS